jgi:hypothetical protein
MDVGRGRRRRRSGATVARPLLKAVPTVSTGSTTTATTTATLARAERLGSTKTTATGPERGAAPKRAAGETARTEAASAPRG